MKKKVFVKKKNSFVVWVNKKENNFSYTHVWLIRKKKWKTISLFYFTCWLVENLLYKLPSAKDGPDYRSFKI